MSKLEIFLTILLFTTFISYTDNKIIIKKLSNSTLNTQNKFIQIKQKTQDNTLFTNSTAKNFNLNSQKVNNASNKIMSLNSLTTNTTNSFLQVNPIIHTDLKPLNNTEPEQIFLPNSCKVDKDCGSTMFICENSKCEHKGFIPVNGRDILGIFVILICSILASSSGIGGGSLLSPFIIAIFGFPTHHAIPLSKLTVFATCFVSFLTTLNVKNPKRDTFALDYNVAGIILPNILFGTTIGVTLNKMLPFSIILIGLITVLLYSTYKSFRSAYQNWQKESEEMGLNKEENEEDKDELKSLTANENVNGNSDGTLENDLEKLNVSRIKELEMSQKDKSKEQINNSKLNEDNDNINKVNNSNSQNNLSVNSKQEYSDEIMEELEREQKIFTFKNWKFFLFSYIVLVLFLLFRGDVKLHSIVGIEGCSVLYWMLYVFFFILAIGITILYSRDVVENYRYRQEINFPFSEYDIEWTYSSIFYYALFGFITGILSGSFGLGGGTILGPFLLHMNMHPTMMKITCNFVVMFSSSALALQFFLAGLLTSNYMIVLVIIATISSIIASLLIAKIVKKYGRPSIIVICVGLVFCISLVTVLISINSKIKLDKAEGINVWAFKSPCLS